MKAELHDHTLAVVSSVGIKVAVLLKKNFTYVTRHRIAFTVQLLHKPFVMFPFKQ